MVSVSIIIPVYNVEKYLSKCLDSVINQSIKEKEIIIVNDGSRDGSKSIIDEYEKKYPYLKVIHKENGGLASARNAGLKIARGEYVGFVDSDDYIEEHMYKNLYEKAKEKQCDIVMGGHLRVYNDHEEEYTYSYDEKITYKSEAIVKDFLTHKISLSSCDKLFKRELFEKNDLFFPEGRLNEDIQVVFGLILNSKNICFDKSPYYHYYQRGGSITKSIKLNSIVDMIAAVEKVKEQLLNKGVYSSFEQEFMGFYYSYIGTSNMMFYQYIASQKVVNEEAIRCKALLKTYNDSIKIVKVFKNTTIDNKNKLKTLLLKTGLLKVAVMVKEKYFAKKIN